MDVQSRSDIPDWGARLHRSADGDIAAVARSLGRARGVVCVLASGRHARDAAGALASIAGAGADVVVVIVGAAEVAVPGARVVRAEPAVSI
jgi:hypothetical protein